MRTLTTFLLLGTLAFSQTMDLSFLDRLSSKAREKSTVDLGPEQLRALATGGKGMEGDVAQAFAAIKGLRHVTVRSLEFEKAGEYTKADVDQLRGQLKKVVTCSPMVQHESDGEMAEVYMCSGKEGMTIAVIAAEPKELTLVYLDGNIDFSALSALGGLGELGRMGTAKKAEAPKAKASPSPKPGSATAPSPAPKEEDESQR